MINIKTGVSLGFPPGPAQTATAIPCMSLQDRPVRAEQGRQAS